MLTTWKTPTYTRASQFVPLLPHTFWASASLSHYLDFFTLPYLDLSPSSNSLYLIFSPILFNLRLFLSFYRKLFNIEIEPPKKKEQGHLRINNSTGSNNHLKCIDLFRSMIIRMQPEKSVSQSLEVIGDDWGSLWTY